MQKMMKNRGQKSDKQNLDISREKILIPLSIGLAGRVNGIRGLLEQVGIYYKIVDFSRPFSANDFPIIVTVGELAENEKQALKRFTANEGSVLNINNYRGILQDYEICKKGFLGGKKCIPEVVSKIHKGQSTFNFINLLALAFEEKGLPFVHKWFYPKKFDGVFGFHVDIDVGCKKDIEKTIDSLSHLDAVWFINCSAIESDKSLLGLFNNKIVGSHNYIHKYFGSKEDFTNVLNADKFLRKQGLNILVFVLRMV